MSTTEPGANGSTGIDKEALYGFNRERERREQKRVDWQDRLHQKAAYMSLDIPEDEEVGDINVDKSTRIEKQEVHHHHAPEKVAAVAKKLGWLAKTAIAVGLIGTGAGAGVGIPMLISSLLNRPQAPVVQPQPGVDTDSDTATELNFWDK